MIVTSGRRQNVSSNSAVMPVAMPPELRKAHQLNDKAVMQAYGFSIKDTTEESCVAELMKMYQQMTSV